MMRILFVDGVCPKPYDPKVLETQALGGTEGTVIRVAEALAARGHQVRVTQHNRETASKFGAEYTAFKANDDFKPTHVVVLRAPLILYTAKKQYPSAKLFLWAHDVFGGDGWAKGFQAMVDTQTIPICVSDWHKSQMYDYMTQLKFQGSIPSRRVYNPIADDLRPDNTPVDKDKLVFFSSPHKGLEYTLKVFEQFKNFKELKDMKLYVANPGYYPSTAVLGSNVFSFGELAHNQVIREVRGALAVLHLNGAYPETMGLVHAESNAVGTPFLSSKLAATPEMADHPSELIDVNDTKAVIDRIIQWRTVDRPRVRGNPNFRMSKIVREWEEVLKL